MGLGGGVAVTAGAAAAPADPLELPLRLALPSDCWASSRTPVETKENKRVCMYQVKNIAKNRNKINGSDSKPVRIAKS